MGFTLIEMIAVVVILAVLGAVAFPRFLSVTDSSHQAKIQELKTQYQEAIRFAHIRWALNGRALTEMNDLPGYGLDENGQPQLDINDEGYPLGTNKNNPMGAPYNIGRGHNGCVDIWEALMLGEMRVTTNRNNFDGFDFVARRQNLTFTTKEGNTVTALAVCYYIYTKRGYNRNPDQAEYVLWYNSRSGVVSTTSP
ncbi:prepilin-type N-terminal cleavage/methylation domain-containing protein [Vibrio sp. OCN044]|uniref:Prepilin-type N-terminal cleavage/methylation domain-containing protein n=2 Tax=Vibrio tetraodonis TaxID=2231647 RepID=A0A6L8M015_9VIBR|nr:prepilin-type N-terminal cleavage/methylation domain-containing protein [Vibrio tetraodonis subsp. pristinus]